MDVDEWVAGFELLLPARKAARQEREEHARQWAESQRRRALVRERNKRESLRITTLDELLRSPTVRPNCAHGWPVWKENPSDADLSRTIDWAQARLRQMKDQLQSD